MGDPKRVSAGEFEAAMRQLLPDAGDEFYASVRRAPKMRTSEFHPGRSVRCVGTAFYETDGRMRHRPCEGDRLPEYVYEELRDKDGRPLGKRPVAYAAQCAHCKVSETEAKRAEAARRRELAEQARREARGDGTDPSTRNR